MNTPTPQSDQAEQLANRIVTAFEGHFREWMMPGEHAEAVEVTKEVIDEFLRAQQAELLALRADKQRLDWLEEFFSTVMHKPWDQFMSDVAHSGFRYAIDKRAALNSPTQKSPAK